MTTFTTYKVGLHNVGSYMVSGVPWITGSETMEKNTEEKIEFPFVTNNFTVVNHTSDTIRVHFNSKATATVLTGFHYVELDSDEDSFTFNVKCKEVYISAPNTGSDRKWRIVASLTQIPAAQMFDIEGSGLTDAP
jgi:hypothetical protein